MNYEKLTVDPGDAGVDLSTLVKVFAPLVHRRIPPLSRLLDEDEFPLAPEVDLMENDSLVPLRHEKIFPVPAYEMVGLDGASGDVLVRSSVAEMLARVADGLPEQFGVAVLDGWRPLSLQEELFRRSGGDASYVSVPSRDPAFAPPHSTGGTVDVTLVYRNRPLALGTPFDEFSPAAHTAALENEDSVEKYLRRVLFWLMYSVGFVNHPNEWWHYEFGTRRWAFANSCAPLFACVDTPADTSNRA